MVDRDHAIEEFLAAAGWGGGVRSPLAGDASFRRYQRITRGGQAAVLMDAPPPHEDVRPFLHICRHLRRLGYSAPNILAAEAEAGLLLLEDFGDDTFTRLLGRGADKDALYALAIDVLIDLHRRPLAEAAPEGLAHYDDARFLDEAMLLLDWTLPAVSGEEPHPGLADRFAACWKSLLPLARAVPDTMVLRDFHVNNLLRIPGRTGIAVCGLLDFQDAVVGPVSYDLMSLLEDARRDVPPALAAAMVARYLAAFPALDAGALELSMAVLGAQRHCKVIGIFTRLSVRDGKPDYLAHIPRVWRLLERALARAELGALGTLLETAFPPALRIAPSCRPAA